MSGVERVKHMSRWLIAQVEIVSSERKREEVEWSCPHCVCK